MNGSERELIEFVRELVQTPSVLGDEGELAQRVAARMRRLGFDRVEIDVAGNVVGLVEGGRDGPTLLFDAHMDTVDVDPREEWTHDPFGGELVGGRIWGRGSSDMKGALAAMIYGLAELDRQELAGRVVVSATVGEEILEGRALAVVMERYAPDWVIIGEASGLALVRAGRGRAELEVETRGKPAHASTPEAGVNAVHRMTRIITEIEVLEMPSHPLVGRGVMCLTDIVSVPYPAHSVVPSGCRVTYERRLIPGESRERLLEELRSACARAGDGDSSVDLVTARWRTYTGMEWEEPKWLPPWELEESHPLVQMGLEGLRRAGLEPVLSSYQFCTNAAYSAGVAGVPTVGFGPSHESLAHITDEYVEIEQLHAARRGYRSLARTLLRKR